MQKSRSKRYASVFVSTTSVLIPIVFGVCAHAQPPQPRSEVVADLPSAASLSDDGVESDQSSELEYLTRAPLHEAFASPYDENPTPNPVVQKAAPNPIDELPPEYRPSGDDVTWIPGYWSWDDERSDFIWISGVWRDIPPQQRWVPGYWADVSDGYQYVSGFWAGDQVADVEYLPQPPESLEQGPASPSPGDNYFYIPGNWVYQSNDYQWQPGFWSQVQQNWVWVPSQYVWTPSGCIYQNGYWDYDVAQRGVVFTPVYFAQPIYRQPQYTYRPQYTVDTGLSLLVHLFVRSNQRQYYYGDYYGSSYSNSYYPWSTRYQRNRYYDPFFASYSHRSHGGGKNNYVTWINSQHQLFANNEQYRPAPTISAQRDLLRTHKGADIDPSVLRLTSMGESLEDLVRSSDNKRDFQRLNRDQIERVRDGIVPQRQLGRDRLQAEIKSKLDQAKSSTEEVPAKSPDANGNLAADVNANAKTDGDKKKGADLNAKASGRGRLRLPELDRRTKAAENTLGRSQRRGENAGTNAVRNAGVGEVDVRAEKAMDSATDAAGDAIQSGSERPIKSIETRPSARDDVKNLSRSGREMRDNVRNRIENAAGDVDRSRRAETPRLRPETPGNWPTATPGQPARKIPGLPEANPTGRENVRSENANANAQGVRSGTRPRGRAYAGPAVDRAPGRGNRSMNDRSPNAESGNPAQNRRGGMDRLNRPAKRGGNVTQPAVSPAPAAAGGEAKPPTSPAASQEKPSSKRAKKTKDK